MNPILFFIRTHKVKAEYPWGCSHTQALLSWQYLEADDDSRSLESCCTAAHLTLDYVGRAAEKVVVTDLEERHRTASCAQQPLPSAEAPPLPQTAPSASLHNEPASIASNLLGSSRNQHAAQNEARGQPSMEGKSPEREDPGETSAGTPTGVHRIRTAQTGMQQAGERGGCQAASGDLHDQEAGGGVDQTIEWQDDDLGWSDSWGYQGIKTPCTPWPHGVLYCYARCRGTS